MAAVVAQVADVWRGVGAFPAGLRWLWSHQRYLLLLMLPVVVAMILGFSSLAWLWSEHERLLSWIYWEAPTQWWWLVLWWLGLVLVYGSAVVVVLALSLVGMSVLAAPIYEIVSTAVERDLTGHDPPGLPWSRQLRAIVTELKKAFFIVFVSLVALLLPGLNILAPIITGLLLAWDLFDYPLARRGWSLRERLRFAVADFWPLLGLGVWLMLPLAQLLLVPLAVTGCTILNIESLRRRQQL